MKPNARFPFFLVLLPVFFFLHGFVERFVPALFPIAAKLAVIYIGIALLLALLCWLLLRDIRKAALAAFALLSFNFFFGNIHDLLLSNFPNAFFVKYSVILPGAVIATALLFFWLKRTRRSFTNLTLYLNLLMLVLIAVDCVTMVFRAAEKRERDVVDLSREFIPCDTCRKPDIYLIVADEYAGKRALNDYFNFDNSAFENELRRRGFYVADSSTSNYNATSYSIASMMSMCYINSLQKRTVNHRDLQLCRQFIKNNNLLLFLKKQGYTIFNNSYFDLSGRKKAVVNPFYPSGELLFTYQTFILRLRRDLGYLLISNAEVEKIVRHHQYNNQTIEDLTRAAVLEKTEGPRFVYTHLALPHHPYYFDRHGKAYPFAELTDSFTMNKAAYIDYLLYANNRLLQLIDHINTNSQQPPVIFLVSDHGFRQFTAETPTDYWFSNLQAAQFPSRDYSRFYHGMSNVNLMRVLLNTEFGQQLPMLKDSTSFLRRIRRGFN